VLVIRLIEIDGCYGEGGGQIVRTAISLSAVTGIPVRITNIRAGRSDAGLKAQHVKAIQTVARLCRGEHSGVTPGSTEVAFTPHEITGGSMRVDIGTAGSIPLLLQCVFPLATVARERISLHLIGGTDVEWSPSIDYIRYVFIPAISKLGFRGSVELIARGYYPRGGGVVKLELLPFQLQPYRFKTDECRVIKGISHSSNLPAHVTRRQRLAAEEALEGFRCDIEEEVKSFDSVGSGITLWCGSSGACSVGRRGLPAEQVGLKAGDALLRELLGGGSVDVHLADQLIPYLALAGSGSFTVRELTSHAKTNMYIVEQLLDVRFEIEKNSDGLFEVWL
jgi:RNA 3'-terminal phosphate cyclase (ATP)